MPKYWLRHTWIVNEPNENKMKKLNNFSITKINKQILSMAVAHGVFTEKVRKKKQLTPFLKFYSTFLLLFPTLYAYLLENE